MINSISDESMYKFVNEKNGIVKKIVNLSSIPDLPIHFLGTNYSPLNLKKNIQSTSFSFSETKAKTDVVYKILANYTRDVLSLSKDYLIAVDEDKRNAYIKLWKQIEISNALSSNLIRVKNITGEDFEKYSNTFKNFLEMSIMDTKIYLSDNIIIIEGYFKERNEYLYGIGVGESYEESLEDAVECISKNINIYTISKIKNRTEKLNIEIVDSISKKEIEVYKDITSDAIMDAVEIQIEELMNEVFVIAKEENTTMDKLAKSKLYPELTIEFNLELIVPEGKDYSNTSRTFHENTKLRTMQHQEDFMYDLNKATHKLKSLTTRGWKNYSYYNKIKLPQCYDSNSGSIEEIIRNRRSCRDYKNQEEITLYELSKILYYSYGITGWLENKKSEDLPLRAVPSGGALYPIEIYLIVNNVEGIEKGIYSYNPFEHSICRIKDLDSTQSLESFTGYSEMVVNSSVIFVLSAFFTRNQWKYKERGYRVMHIDCGHMAQNIHLMSTACDLGSCCIMGFVDNALNNIIGLDGVEESSLYMVTVGKIK